MRIGMCSTVASCLVSPGAKPLTWDGTLPGEWVMEPRGDGGFGYDYVLQTDLGVTVAQMSADAKHARSHRGVALRAFVAWWASKEVKPRILSRGLSCPDVLGLLFAACCLLGGAQVMQHGASS